MTFLPPDYKPPTPGGKYMKFSEGANRFRVLSDEALRGYEGWSVPTKERPNGSPIRKLTKEEFAGIALKKDDKGRPGYPKHFLGFAIWNPDEKRVQVLQLTQSTIIGPLSELVKDEDWGDPRAYDIVVTRTTQGEKTSYTVTPKPKKALPKEAADAWSDLQDRFDIGRLLSGGDPFGDTMPGESGNGGNGQEHDELNPPPDDGDIPF